MALILRETITQTFLDRVHQTPQRVGFEHRIAQKWVGTSYRDFYNQCRNLSFGLMSLGVARGEKVALLSHTRLEWSLSDMAILGAGAVTVPVYPSSTPQEVAYILNHAEASVVIVEDQVLLQKLLSARATTVRKIVVIETVSQDLPAGALTLAQLSSLGEKEESRGDPQRFDRNLESAKPEDVFTICYTSGTTGVPKGVMLTHANMMSVLSDCAAVFGHHVVPESETILSFMPFSHILGRVESLAGYTFGWKEAFAESFDKLMSNMAEVRPTIIFAAPRVFEKAYARIMAMSEESGGIRKRLFDWSFQAGYRYYASIWSKDPMQSRNRLEYVLAKRLVFRNVYQRFGGRLKFAIAGGAPLTPELAEFFQIIGVQVLEGYGLTETCAPVTLNTPEQVRFGSVGRPLPEVSIKIADDSEILVKSKKVFQGYFKAPEETAEAIDAEGWLRTGDMGYLDEAGFLHITDRKKDIIVTSAGKNIAPQKIENLAKRYPFLSQLVVHGDRRNYLTALVTLNYEEAIRYAAENQILFSEYSELVRNTRITSAVQKVIDDINQELASFETIKKFMILPRELTVESGELTPSLKVRRRVIASRYKDLLDSMYAEKPLGAALSSSRGP